MRWQKGEREQYWRRMLEKQCESGLGIRAFCKRENISEPSMYGWKRKLAAQAPQHPAAEVSRSESSDCVAFVPVQLPPDATNQPIGGMEVVHRSGTVVRVSSDFDSRTLGHVLDLLDERG